MFSSLIEVARNSPFRTPVMSQVECQETSANKALVPSRNIVAADTAEGGIFYLYFYTPIVKKLVKLFQTLARLVQQNILYFAGWEVSFHVVS